ILRQYSKSILDYGDQFVVGTSTPANQFLTNWIINALSVPTNSPLLEPLTPAAEGFLREASALLDRYLPGGGEAKALSPEQRAEVEKEMLGLQERFQAEMQPLLSEEQRKRLSMRVPLIIRVEPGNKGVSISNRWNPF